MSATQMFTPQEDVIIHRFDDGMVIYVANNDRFLGLDNIGAEVWDNLCRLGSVGDVVQVMLEVYDTDESTLRNDIESICQQMVDIGALTLKGVCEEGNNDYGLERIQETA